MERSTDTPLRTRLISELVRNSECLLPAQLLDAITYLSERELANWSFIQAHFLEAPAFFPIPVNAWIELRNLSKDGLQPLALACPSFCVSILSFFGGLNGICDSLEWAIRKSKPPFDASLFQGPSAQLSKSTTWLASNFLRTWSHMAKVSPMLCRACTGLPWELIKHLADAEFTALSIELLIHRFPIYMLPTEASACLADNSAASLAVWSDLINALANRPKNSRVYRKTIRAYIQALLSQRSDSALPAPFSGNRISNAVIGSLFALNLPCRSVGRLVGSTDHFRNSPVKDQSPRTLRFKASFWRTQDGLSMVEAIKTLIIRGLPPNYGRGDVIQSLLIACAIALNLYGMELSLANLRNLVIAVEKRLSGFLNSLAAPICGECATASAKNKYLGVQHD